MSSESITVQGLASQIKPEDEVGILRAAQQKLRSEATLKGVTTLLRNVRILFRMVRDGSFSMTWATRALVLGGLTYFVLPTDAAPDYLPLIGYIDDTLVIGWLIKRLSSEIDRYKQHVLDRT